MERSTKISLVVDIVVYNENNTGNITENKAFVLAGSTLCSPGHDRGLSFVQRIQDFLIKRFYGCIAI